MPKLALVPLTLGKGTRREQGWMVLLGSFIFTKELVCHITYRDTTCPPQYSTS